MKEGTLRVGCTSRFIAGEGTSHEPIFEKGPGILLGAGKAEIRDPANRTGQRRWD